MISKFALLSAVLIASLSSLECGAQTFRQTLPAGFASVDGNGVTNWPQNTTNPQKWQWVYDSSEFAATGPIRILNIETRASDPTIGVRAFDFPSWIVSMGAARTDYSINGTMSTPGHDPIFENNWRGTPRVVRSGPFAGGPVAATNGVTSTWIPWGLDCSFAYDPTNGDDLIVQIDKCRTTSRWFTTMDGSSGRPGQNGGNRYGTSNGCNTVIHNFNGNEFVPIIRITYERLVGVEYETNGRTASLDIDGVQGDAYGGARIVTCTDTNHVLNLGGQAGLPWEMAISPDPSLAASCGGTTTAGGQAVNLDLQNPGLTFLYGGTVPSLTVPFAGRSSSPFNVGLNPRTFTLQMAAVDPSHPDGIALSQASEASIGAGLILDGPDDDDVTFSYGLGGLPLCGPASLPFYGTSFSEIHVSDNGRVLFDQADIDFSPSLADAMLGSPFVGFWTDIDPRGGTVRVFSTGNDIVQVVWQQVTYLDETATFDLAIQFVASTGAITVSSLNTIPVNPVSTGFATGGDGQWLGLSGGAILGATDGGMTVFGAGGSGSTANATDMLYDLYDAFGTGGAAAMLPSLASGALSSVEYTPNAGGGYSWVGR